MEKLLVATSEEPSPILQTRSVYTVEYTELFNNFAQSNLLAIKTNAMERKGGRGEFGSTNGKRMQK